MTVDSDYKNEYRCSSIRARKALLSRQAMREEQQQQILSVTFLAQELNFQNKVRPPNVALGLGVDMFNFIIIIIAIGSSWVVATPFVHRSPRQVQGNQRSIGFAAVRNTAKYLVLRRTRNTFSDTQIHLSSCHGFSLGFEV